MFFGRYGQQSGCGARSWGMNSVTCTSSIPCSIPSRLVGWLGCALILTGAVSASGEGRSGVKGVITLSPACGGPQREGNSCSAPYPNVELRLISGSGATVASTRTSSAGDYLLPVPAGKYRVVVAPSVRFTRCPSPEVVVEDKQVSVIDIDCDSGMR
jgi:hypothetical protein